jgi:hypothetical protein
MPSRCIQHIVESYRATHDYTSRPLIFADWLCLAEMGDGVEGELGILSISLTAMGAVGFGYRCCLGIFRQLQWASMVSLRGWCQSTETPAPSKVLASN